jgi:hypothetical protein
LANQSAQGSRLVSILLLIIVVSATGRLWLEPFPLDVNQKELLILWGEWQ